MVDFCFCEQCKYSELHTHDPERTGEEIYDPRFYCTFARKDKIQVHAFDYCSHGVMKPGLPLREEQKIVVKINCANSIKAQQSAREAE